MSFNVEQPCPLCILHSDEACSHLCFMSSVNNIIRCGTYSCSTCECAVGVGYIPVSVQWHFWIEMKKAKGWDSWRSVLFRESVFFFGWKCRNWSLSCNIVPKKHNNLAVFQEIPTTHNLQYHHQPLAVGRTFYNLCALAVCSQSTPTARARKLNQMLISCIEDI